MGRRKKQGEQEREREKDGGRECEREGGKERAPEGWREECGMVIIIKVILAYIAYTGINYMWLCLHCFLFF